MSKENMFLTLDGGGSKGIYTLSILEEIENLLPEDQVLNSVLVIYMVLAQDQSLRLG